MFITILGQVKIHDLAIKRGLAKNSAYESIVYPMIITTIFCLGQEKRKEITPRGLKNEAESTRESEYVISATLAEAEITTSTSLEHH